MPEPLDLDQYRSFATIARVHGDHEKAGMLTILTDEIERLRAIAAPLERLEAWRRSFRLIEFADMELFTHADGTATARVDSEKHGFVEGHAPTVAAAITAALDAWYAKHGKDAPHA